MAYIVKDVGGNVVLSVRYDDIPQFLEDNPDHIEARLMRQHYENWQNRNTEPCYTGPIPDDAQLKLFRSIIQGLDEEFWQDEGNVRFIREQGIVNVNKSKHLPEEYYGLALVPISCHGLFDSPWDREFEILGQEGDIHIDGKAKYKRIAVRRRCFGTMPKLYDIKERDELLVPDDAGTIVERIIDDRLKGSKAELVS